MPADHSAEEDTALFVAGHTAPVGTYRLVKTGREVRPDLEDVLPATCDGHVGVYIRQPMTWAEVPCPKGCTRCSVP